MQTLPIHLLLVLTEIIATLAMGPSTAEDNPEFGELIFGDILTKEAGLPKISAFNVITDKTLLWTNNTLYYDIDSTYNAVQVNNITRSVRDLIEAVRVDGELCVDIIRIDSGEPGAPQNYIYLEPYSGCSSYVGMIGGSQRMSLVDSCVTRPGTIQHEFMHAMGFYHEHQRSDRESFINITWTNVESGAYSNFFETRNSNNQNQTYDYDSVMHYPRNAFAIDPSMDTITPLDPDADIGQRVGVSPLDIKEIQLLYGCIPPESVDFLQGVSYDDLFIPVEWNTMEPPPQQPDDERK